MEYFSTSNKLGDSDGRVHVVAKYRPQQLTEDSERWVDMIRNIWVESCNLFVDIGGCQFGINWAVVRSLNFAGALTIGG